MNQIIGLNSINRTLIRLYGWEKRYQQKLVIDGWNGTYNKSLLIVFDSGFFLAGMEKQIEAYLYPEIF
jgi:hypothetical protein